MFIQEVLDSIVVSISACHAEDPGSIPGRGVRFFFFSLPSIDLFLLVVFIFWCVSLFFVVVIFLLLFVLVCYFLGGFFFFNISVSYVFCIDVNLCLLLFFLLSQADCILLVGLDEKGPSESMGQVNIVC